MHRVPGALSGRVLLERVHSLHAPQRCTRTDTRTDTSWAARSACSGRRSRPESRSHWPRFLGRTPRCCCCLVASMVAGCGGGPRESERRERVASVTTSTPQARQGASMQRRRSGPLSMSLRWLSLSVCAHLGEALCSRYSVTSTAAVVVCARSPRGRNQKRCIPMSCAVHSSLGA